LTIAVEVYNGIKKNGYEPAFKNAKFWTNENHWDGQQNQTLERKLRSCLKISYPCRKWPIAFYKRPESDFLENQNWFWNFLC
jgi:hypothetical protein